MSRANLWWLALQAAAIAAGIWAGAWVFRAVAS